MGKKNLNINPDKFVKSAPSLVEEDYADGTPNFWGLNQGVSATLQASLIGGVSGALGLYSLSLIDDRAVEGFAFSTGDDPSLIEMIEEAEKYAQLSGKSYVGAVSRLKGYVAEQDVAAHLTDQGCIVEFPLESNQEAFDLLVDGNPMQVKCVSDPSSIFEHLTDHPEIPVITNVEMSSYFDDSSRIFIDSDLSVSDIAQRTQETVSGLDLLDNIDDVIPFAALAISTFRHGRVCFKGDLNKKIAGRRILVDTASIGGISWACANVGLLVGSLLGPGGMVAGSALGGYLGARIGREAADNINFAQLHRAADQLVAQLTSFGQWVTKDLLINRLNSLKQKRERVVAALGKIERSGNKAALRAKRAALENFDCLISRTRNVIDYMNRIAFSPCQEDRIHAGWVSLNHARFLFHPEISRKITMIHDLTENYRELYQNKS